MTPEFIAKACHEVNRIYCQYIGDHSQLPWEQAPPWQRESAVRGVETLLENPGNTPEQQHLAWMKDKLAQGWKYGLVKDAEKKEHPCLVPYQDLLPAQKVKDQLFIGTVELLLAVDGRVLPMPAAPEASA